MILLDFSSISTPIVFTTAKEGITKDKLRHMILNSIRMYNLKYRDKYGQMVICCDSNSWRKDYFSLYKAGRHEGREKSDIDWAEAFGWINEILEEIKDNFPYPVVRLHGAEADDIIATLVEKTQIFGQHEEVMIVSADKDFVQLQKYGNVAQYSPMTRKSISHPDPVSHLEEHIFRGDGSDGVPNVLSDDDTFVTEGKRQKPLRKKIIEQWLEADDLEQAMGPDLYANYLRNRKMIDLSQIPDDIKSKIEKAYNEAVDYLKDKRIDILGYLIKNQCKALIGGAGDFIAKP